MMMIRWRLSRWKVSRVLRRVMWSGRVLLDERVAILPCCCAFLARYMVI